MISQPDLPPSPEVLDIIYCKNCQAMKELPGGSIDLIVSGPPYWDYIDYDKCASGDVSVGTWSGNITYDSFLEKMGLCYSECYRVMRPGRFCIVNVGTVPENGATVPLPFDMVGVLCEVGWVFRYEIIWHKVSGGRQNARLTVRKPYPGRYLPNIRTEYLLVFQKKPEIPFDRCGPDRVRGAFRVNNFFKREIANNVWYIQPARNDGVSRHPCPFPPEIPLRLIQLFSTPGETVLDPFMGIGTTARAAKMLSRHFIGYEQVPFYVQRAYELLNKPLRIPKGIYCCYQNTEENKEWYGP